MQQDINCHFGNKLREARLKRGETLESLSARLNISHQQLYKYEKGESKISSEILYKVSNYLSLPIEFFFQDINHDESEKSLSPKIDIHRNHIKRLNILIVEDDPNDVYLLEKALSYNYKNVKHLTLNEANTALNFLKNGASNKPNTFIPHLIILDLSLPNMDGFDFLKSMKHDRALKSIPVIVMTNSINRQDMERSYNLGANGYICKPFEYEEFQAVVNKLIDYWRNVVILPD